MTAADENTIVTCGAVVIGITTLRDMLPPERGGKGEGFQPTHLLGGMAATTMLLLAGQGAPQVAKAFAIMTATIAFLYSGANMAEQFFTGQETLSPYEEAQRKRSQTRKVRRRK